MHRGGYSRERNNRRYCIWAENYALCTLGMETVQMSLIVRNGKVQLAIKIEGKAKKYRTDVSEADWRRKEAQKAIEDMRIQKELLGGDPW